MKAEGDCPDCGSKLGVKVGADGLPLPESTIKRLMNRDGNGMYCQMCDKYHDPDDIEVRR